MRFVLNPALRKIRFLPLVAATYFMVSGGPYGIEDILGGAGYARAIIILLTLPLLWSLPTALMIGELAAAIPAEGGFYVWVSRGLGPFWGYQESWLSLTASVFDMALYPSIFVLYLGKFNPALTAGPRAYLWSLAVVVLCCAWNLLGAPEVGRDSVWLFALLLAPFAIFVALGFWQGLTVHPAVHWGRTAAQPGAPLGLSTAILVALWNYMGWDNASTIATEVERPQRTYPRAMLVAVAIVCITYVLPFAAMWMTGLPASAWETGAWADIAQLMGGPVLRIALVAGGMMSGFGMFNALVMSYSRLPLAMAQDGMLPKVFGKLHKKSRAPWVAILALAVGWGLALNLGFERLVTLDIMIYGASLALEFIALICLRIREPELKRPFRVPGGLFGAIAVGIPPVLLLGFAIIRSEHEAVLGMSSLWFGLILMGLGVVAYAINHALKPAGWTAVEPKPEMAA